MKTYTYRVHLQAEPEGGFTVTVPALPGCVTWGEDVEQALAMAREAIQVYLESLVQTGDPIPEEPNLDAVEAIVQVAVPKAA